MAITLQIPNFKRANCVETATVGKDSVKDQPVVTFDNADRFAANDYILIGKQGGGVSQIYQIESIAANVVTLKTNLEFYAERGTTITKLFGDKVKVYTAPYVAGSSPTQFTALNGGLIDIDPDSQTTMLLDPNGNDQVWYKYTYYNSFTTNETSLTDSTPVRDTRTNDYCSLDAIRHQAGFDSTQSVTDEDLAFHRRAAQARIDGMLAGKYSIPFSTPVDPQIEDITCRLAAGYAMISEYGTFDGIDKTKGEKKRDDALEQLKDLQTGSSILTGVDGVSDVLPDSGGFSSGFGGTDEALFQKDYISGYYGREY